MDKLQRIYEREIGQLAEASRRLGELGYVASHGGNLSFRVAEDLVLITPTKVSKRVIGFDDIVAIDFNGEIRFAKDGRKPTGETPIHLNILRRRPDLKGLIHAHPPILTGFSMLEEEHLAQPLLPEPIIELGPVRYVAYEEPLSQRLASAFDEVIEKSNAFLMRNHGALVCSVDGVGRALELLEMLESMAHSVFVATSLGKATRIPLAEVEKLERTIKTRGLPMPGAPGAFSRLADAYRSPFKA